MSKAKNKIKISFPNEASNTVTGSGILLEMSDCNILLEFGLYQSNNIKKDFQINSTKPPFKPKDLDYVFMLHQHIDHTGKVPYLYANGCEAKIIAPKGSSKLFSIMGLDSSYIMSRDTEILKKSHKMNVSPLYNDDDVFNTINYIDEYEIGQIYELTNNIKFQFLHSGHILLSTMLVLWLTENGQTKKIVYTSDLGGNLQKPYTHKRDKIPSCNLLIAESTYSDDVRTVNKKDQSKDLQKIESVIRNTCCEKKSKVLIPTFSLQRTPEILTHLYDIFHEDKEFKIKIILDSPLATKLLQIYLKLLDGEEKEKLTKVLAWDNIKITDTYTESQMYQKSKEPMVLVCASGMMTSGRSRNWAKVIVPNASAHILFIGFASEGSLAGKLRDDRKNKTISIDGKSYPNRCGITGLHSMSSHIQYEEMLKVYSEVNTEKIALVHGEYKSKCKFSAVLQDEISKKNNTSKVSVVNKGTVLQI